MAEYRSGTRVRAIHQGRRIRGVVIGQDPERGIEINYMGAAPFPEQTQTAWVAEEFVSRADADEEE